MSSVKQRISERVSVLHRVTAAVTHCRIINLREGDTRKDEQEERRE